MRRYDDCVDVMRGQIGDIEGPARFMWRARLWQVCAVVSHWVETGPWWEHQDIHDLLGVGVGVGVGARDGDGDGAVSVAALLAERDVWRVEAGQGRTGPRAVVDLSFDWATGRWRLVRCLD